MSVSFGTKYEREFTELQRDETGGLPKEKFEKLYKNNKPTVRYFLYRAYGLMKKANEAFAVSSCVSKATKDRSKKVCSEIRECLINMLVECDEIERFFDTVKIYGDMLKSNVGFVTTQKKCSISLKSWHSLRVIQMLRNMRNVCMKQSKNS